MSNQLFANQDTSKIFVWDNRTATFNFNNATYADIDLTAGMIMGRISATGLIQQLDASASDGSQFPIGILFESQTVEAGDTVQLTVCVSGDVVENKVVLKSGTTMNSVISGRRLFDRIGSDTVGVKLVQDSEELTTFDNPDNAL
jgi:hypothetical protein